MKGPKGKVQPPSRAGIKLEQKDGVLTGMRENESQARRPWSGRALVFNAVEGVTKGWTKELDIVGIGYRAEMKGKGIGGVHAGLFAPDRVSAAHGHRSRHRSEADAR